jgi:hypothetical protein
MILVQIATALAIGAYVVLSKDARPKRPNATPRKLFQHRADRLPDRDGCPEPSAIHDYILLTDVVLEEMGGLGFALRGPIHAPPSLAGNLESRHSRVD